MNQHQIRVVAIVVVAMMVVATAASILSSL